MQAETSKVENVHASPAIIFDMDGCLVDSEPLCLDTIADEMRSRGLVDASVEMISERFLGVGMSDIAAHVSSQLDGRPQVDFAERVEERLQERYKSELQLIEGIEGLLAMLVGNQIPFAIATGASSKRMAFTLEVSGLSEYFPETAFSVDDVARGKPAPDLFLHAAEKLGVRPTDCIVLEDSPHGIKGACAAGMKPFGFVGGAHLANKKKSHTSVLRDAGAQSVVETLLDFQSLLSAHIETKTQELELQHELFRH